MGYCLSAIPQPHSKLSYRLLAISYRLSAIGYRLSAIGYRLSAIGYRLSAIGYRLSPIVQCRFDDTLQRRSLTGSAVAICSPRNPGAGFTRLSSGAEKNYALAEGLPRSFARRRNSDSGTGLVRK
jgi:hypothetical protein